MDILKTANKYCKNVFVSQDEAKIACVIVKYNVLAI